MSHVTFVNRSSGFDKSLPVPSEETLTQIRFYVFYSNHPNSIRSLYRVRLARFNHFTIFRNTFTFV